MSQISWRIGNKLCVSKFTLTPIDNDFWIFHQLAVLFFSTFSYALLEALLGHMEFLKFEIIIKHLILDSRIQKSTFLISL